MMIGILTTNAYADYTISDADFLDNGWSKPLYRALVTNSNYDYDSKAYLANNKFRHGAYDIRADYNEKVYPIDDGIVKNIRRDVSPEKNLSVVYIEHETVEGKKFLGLYGHVYAVNGLKVGDTVKPTDVIGNIRTYGSPNHLHFGISTSLNATPTASWGAIRDDNGIVHPINYLKDNNNGCPIPLEPPLSSLPDAVLTDLNSRTKTYGAPVVSETKNAAHQDSRVELVIMLVRLFEFIKQKQLPLDPLDSSLDGKLTDIASLSKGDKDALRKAINMNLIDSGSNVSFRPNCRVTQNEAYVLFERAYNWLYVGNARPSVVYPLSGEFATLKGNISNMTRVTTAKYLLALYNSASSSSSWDISPNPFTFAPLTNVELSKVVTSNTVTVSGINKSVQASTQNGKFSVGCQFNFDSSPKWVVNNDKVCVQHTSSTQANTPTKTTLTIGNQSADFTSTTKANLNSAPIVDGTSIPSTLTVDNGKSGFVLKTTEAVASVQLKINGVNYNLVPDGSRKSWTFNATNLAQQGQVNYELAVLKTGALTPIKQTGTFTLKSSTVTPPNVGKAGEFAAYLDPQKLGEKWQTGKDALIDKTLAAGYLKMTPAELIYYSSIKENKIK